MGFGGEGSAHALERLRTQALRLGRRQRDGFARGVSVAGGEAAQARLGPLAESPDRGFASSAWQRQRPRAGKCAEHDRTDHRARLAREALHVEQLRPAGECPPRLDDALAVEACVAHRHLLDCGVDAMRRGDQGSALRGDEAVLQRACRLEQLGGEHDVDVAGGRRKRHDRAPLAQFGGAGGVDLEVVGGRTGALRDARDRGALHRVALRRRCSEDPVGEHAAAFAAEGGNQHGEGAFGQGHGRLRGRQGYGPESIFVKLMDCMILITTYECAWISI